jgi:phosphopantothenoylcysteine decarboxylase / phosphopantothenate---cysteine ligase
MITDPHLLPYQPLLGKLVLLGVTGGIAAYKAADLASNLVQLGADVHVLMTHSATEFVGPTTFAALTQNPVHDTAIERWEAGYTGHISLGQSAAAFVVAPATANTIAKLALGLADDMIGTVALTTQSPLVIAPAMEHEMFHHPATQAHVATLRDRGALIVGPDTGRLASGEYGEGRLTTAAIITGAVRQAIGLGGPLTGRTIVVTAGGTFEALDPVRYIGNRSSGRMGYSLAQSAIDAGARVILITGPSNLPTPYGACVVRVESAEQMNTAVQTHVKAADAILMTAAVADFRPSHPSLEKIKKQEGQTGLTVELDRNPDIIGGLRDAPLLRVGFAAETSNHVLNATDKLTRKNLDMVVVNDAVDTIGSTTIQATLVSRSNEPEILPRMVKERMAALIIERLPGLLENHS